MSSLKILASVAVLTFIGGYGLSKFYYTQEEYDDYYDEEEETTIVKNSTSSSLTYTNNTLTTTTTPKKFQQQKPISKRKFMLIENLICNITTKQNQAVNFRKKYHRNLNEILKQIDDMREKICITEEEQLKKIHNLLDKIEYCNKFKDLNLHENKSYVNDLKNKVLQEEAYLDTELRVLQADLGMLMWKYEELENYDLKEWNDSQLEIQQLREKLMRDAVRR